MNRLRLLTACVLLIVLGSACESERPPVQLALKEGGKVYLYSQLGAFLVNNSLNAGQVPPLFSSTYIYTEEGLFVDPLMLGDIANLMAGNYQLHPHEESTHSGYVTVKDQKIHRNTLKVQNTEEIGKQVQQQVLSLGTLNHTDTMEIIWQGRTADEAPIAVANCIVKSLWVNRSVQPGVTSIVEEETVLVDLNAVAQFYAARQPVALEYNEDQGILYIIR